MQFKKRGNKKIDFTHDFIPVSEEGDVNIMDRMKMIE